MIVLMHLLGYAVLVPHIQARYVTFTFWVLLGARTWVDAKYIIPGRYTGTLVARGIIVNMVGMMLACLAETQKMSVTAVTKRVTQRKQQQ